MAQTRTKAPSFRRTASALWHSLAKDLFDPYRPELHYMRGPGPRWRAKHAQPRLELLVELADRETGHGRPVARMERSGMRGTAFPGLRGYAAPSGLQNSVNGLRGRLVGPT